MELIKLIVLGVIVFGAITVGVVIILGWGVQGFAHWWHNFLHTDYGRKLTKPELDFVKQNSLRLSIFRGSQKFPMRYQFLWIFILLLIAICMLAACIVHAVFLIVGSIAFDQVFPLAPGDVEVGNSMVSFFPALLIGALLFLWLAVPLARRVHGVSNFLVLNSQAQEERLTHFIRARRLDPKSEYTVQDLTDLILDRYTPLHSKALKYLLIFTFVFLCFDLLYKEVYSKDSLRHRPYFSFITKEYSFSTLKEMRPECEILHTFGDDEAEINYHVIFQNGPRLSYIGLSLDRSEKRVLKRLLKTASHKTLPMELKVDRDNPEGANLTSCLSLAEAKYGSEEYAEIAELVGLTNPP